MGDGTGGSLLGEHAVYPGTFDPVTPGHLDVIERARHLFVRVTVLVAVNSSKQPSGAPSDRAVQLRQELPPGWDNVSVAAWDGLTVAFCRQHGAGVIIRGVRNGSDWLHEHQLAAMNQAMGITTLLLPARPGLAGVSSTVLRGLGTFPEIQAPRRWSPLGLRRDVPGCCPEALRDRAVPAGRDSGPPQHVAGAFRARSCAGRHPGRVQGIRTILP